MKFFSANFLSSNKYFFLNFRVLLLGKFRFANWFTGAEVIYKRNNLAK